MSGRGECEEPASTAIEDADDDNGRPCGSRNGGAVGKQPDGDEAPEAARAMHLHLTDRRGARSAGGMGCGWP